ncbi:MAG: DUF3108 domain-containing protein [Candidatus Omnitrophota bacterium]
MKKNSLFLLILIIAVGILITYCFLSNKFSNGIYKNGFFLFSSPEEPNFGANFIFKKGETINYDVKLRGFKIGTAKMSYKGIVAKNGLTGVLVSFLADVANFKDLENIYIDLETFNPLFVVRKISLIIRKETIEEDYFSKRNSVVITKNKKFQNARTITSDAPFQHIISSIYYYRTLEDFEVGNELVLNLPLYKLKLQVKRIEEVEVPAGKFKAFYIESIPNKFKFWFSADEKRLPLKVEGVVSLAPAVMMMTKYETEKED